MVSTGWRVTRAAANIVTQLQTLLPNRPSNPEAQLDIFTPVARFYLEMGEFVEVAGVTCASPEAVPWLLEAAFNVLRRTNVTVNGRPVPLCHTPTDYNDYTSGGEGTAAYAPVRMPTCCAAGRSSRMSSPCWRPSSAR